MSFLLEIGWQQRNRSKQTNESFIFLIFFFLFFAGPKEDTSWLRKAMKSVQKKRKKKSERGYRMQNDDRSFQCGFQCVMAFFELSKTIDCVRLMFVFPVTRQTQDALSFFVLGSSLSTYGELIELSDWATRSIPKSVRSVEIAMGGIRTSTSSPPPTVRNTRQFGDRYFR